MLQPFARAAEKALSLKKDNIFGLLVIMTAMLGWLTGLGAASIVGLHNVHEAWQLEKKSNISVYLLAESKEGDIQNLSEELAGMPGVRGIKRVGREELMALIDPHFENNANFPLPVVLEVSVTESLNRERFDNKIIAQFPTAEIDDARTLLSSVGQGVRIAQLAGLVMAIIMIVITIMLVSLTIRAGLRAQNKSLFIMQYVGATDGFLTDLISRQVFGRSLVGWVIDSILTLASVGLILLMWPGLADYISLWVWVASALAPLMLPITAVLVAWITAKGTIQNAAS